ncbi:AraC family transcriptional regulator [Paenibacillus eucommiae]|uniref:AraC-like DNA-binding protein/mannose-6-phosphate isomerase-like protein (Cupin superfamily) n=1 Tax=Paenibacillus eucommiae TaxID=1355755 RepID=A0ABS4J1E8_9BACL|nr:AraC family transcriptional regulator [Paenibacillus eucommiae]MBP1993657.1 AraC-like DNA-binding protein/mannose-6-phosphate isomerase-like protein (cupin superfamily) [Paenibacillus eucommiae]
MGLLDISKSVKLMFNPDKVAGVQIIEWTLDRVQQQIHWHPTLELCLCLSGHGRFTFTEKQYELGPGDIILVNNTERHTSQSNPGDDCVCLVFCINMRTIHDYDRDLLLPFIYDPKTFNHLIPAESATAQKVGRLLLEMNLEMSEGQSASRKIVKSILFQVCALLVRYYKSDEMIKSRKQITWKFIMLQPALLYIQTNYQEPLCLADIAGILSLSPSRSRHLFQEVLGEGFKSYLLQVRIQQAKQLLAQTDTPITDIYLSCGFQSSTSFYREFKKITTITPHEFRKQASEIHE